MNNEGFGGFPLSIAAINGLFFAFYNQLPHIMAEVWTNSKIKLMDKCYGFIKM